VTVSVEEVSFRYGRALALSSVSWRIDPGVNGLLGPNGAGKTTLLNLLVGIARPDEGFIRRGGVASARAGGVGRVGFMPQRFSVAGEMRVLDTVMYAAWINGVSSRDCPEAAVQALRTVRLDDLASRRVRQLSGGQRQRLGLAAALAHRPDFVVLDEPTVGLDPSQRLRVREIIAEIGQTRTVVLSTHLVEDIVHLCTSVAVLAQGRMAFVGSVDELSSLIESSQPTGHLGSAFERSYDSLIGRLNAEVD